MAPGSLEKIRKYAAFHYLECRGRNRSPGLDTYLEQLEAQILILTFRHCDGNYQATANLLGLKYKTLATRMRRLRSGIPGK